MKETETEKVDSPTRGELIEEVIARDINYYNNGATQAAKEKNLTNALHSYAMINTDDAVGVTFDWVNQLLHKDGKNRKVMTDSYNVDAPDYSPEAEEVDKYYQTALSIAFNQFLEEQKDGAYYEKYAETISIFLISEGMKDMISSIELPDNIKTKTEDILITIEDRIRELVLEARKKCEVLQPELLEKFIELEHQLINEPTSAVVTRWFTTDDGKVIINDELVKELRGLRTEFLRYVKRNGKVELATLIRLFGVNKSTYDSYKKGMINKVLPKCDASLMSYVKFLMLSKD